nr:serinethreonine-protein kinase edr1 [Ipomoea batatas]
MEQSKGQNHLHYNTREQSNAQVIPETQVLKRDLQEYDHPDLNHQETKPVLNYSIQTGEEFSLEFMLDRFNTRKPQLPNTSVDPSHTPGYLELKGILGIAHTGSERGSDVSMLTTMEGPRDIDERNSSLLCQEKSNSGSMLPAQQTSSEHNGFRSLIYASSGASDSLVARLKILCSFGGKILPRPSDGKLRYVGGDTRIIRVRKDIMWHELWHKAIAIYDHTHIIKYQLPGEDLDALVSVSCDEDLQNMMEECNVLDDTEGTKKLRMFLFSMIDLEDTHFSLSSSHADCEIQYVVAVNGFDLESRKSSILHCLGSSANNLAELDVQNVEMDTGKLPHYDDGKPQNFQSTYNLNSYMRVSESLIPRQNGILAQKEDIEEQLLDGLSEQHLQSSIKPVKSDANASAYQGGEVQGDQMLSNEQLSASHLVIKNAKGYFPIENEGRSQYPIQISSALETVSPELPRSGGNNCSSASVLEPSNSEPAPIDLSFFEPTTPPPPQRVFRSERIPREQAELLNRISKSDDSHNSQLLMTHPHPDVAQADFLTESVEKVQKT